jgi:methionyl-tRNA synthetase
LTETSIGSDLKFSYDNLTAKYNNVLIKEFGNLVQRMFNLIKPVELEINSNLKTEYYQEVILQSESNYLIKINKFLSDLDLIDYIESINWLISKSNKDLTDLQPWKLELNDKVNVLTNLIINLKIIFVMLYPIIPNKIIEFSEWIGWKEKLNFSLNSDIELKIKDKEKKFIAFQIIKS